MEKHFPPGSLIRARNRDWVVQSGSSDDFLRLRPLGGAEDEVVSLIPDLEHPKVEPAVFPWPDSGKTGPFYSAGLLYDALRFELRQGAGPFRSFGSLAFEPRSYQFVPLLMAMRQRVVRLLIADDVGIGKTIEAGLIVRELFDRGEITNFAVLCPPQLVDQWVSELSSRFNFLAEALTSGTAARLEKRIPAGKKFADVFPFLVVSLDYIKSERHRDYFETMNYELFVVDEAHTCTSLSSMGRSRQLRFETLKRLSQNEDCHMIFLTATPHSGNEQGFHNLLSLLDPRFASLGESAGKRREELRQELAKHFVQRRRVDITEWQVADDDHRTGFPKRMNAECTYTLSRDSEEFLNAVRDYCRRMVGDKSFKSRSGRFLWYAAIALLRCASSSPAAAVQSLTNRMEMTDEAREEAMVDSLEDDFAEPDSVVVNDVEPAAAGEEDSLKRLLTLAQNLKNHPEKDNKLSTLVTQVKKLVADGFSPVVFCRYIATAHYVEEALRRTFESEKDIVVTCVTGELVPEERRSRIEELADANKRVLVATDCLSEGINLQEHLTAVVHYDLAWNPTRHEQREGRIDRFGQRAPKVRTLMIYGSDNPVDGFILRVILKKSEAIRKSLGVTVPVPADQDLIAQALLEASLFRHKAVQDELFSSLKEADEKKKEDEIELEWENSIEKMRRTRTVFAQRAIHPEEVYPLWEAKQRTLGSQNDVEKFCQAAAAALGFRFEEEKPGMFRLPASVPEALSLRLADIDLGREKKRKTIRLDKLHRTSPLVNTLSEAVFEESLKSDSQTISRSSVTVTSRISRVTRLFLLRIRFQMRVEYRNRNLRILMAEEILPVAACGVKNVEWDMGPEAGELIRTASKGNLAAGIVQKQVGAALELLRNNEEKLREIAKSRAKELLNAHNLAKPYTAKGSVAQVEPCLPVDVMGVFVLLPEEDE